MARPPFSGRAIHSIIYLMVSFSSRKNFSNLSQSFCGSSYLAEEKL
jgi:hypothetical protein